MVASGRGLGARLFAVLTVAVLGGILSGCAAATPVDEERGDDLNGTITVYAAASLASAFAAISERFEDANPGVDVRPLVTDGSSTLATQLIAGAPADVFASADAVTMGTVQGAGAAGESTVFARNTLVVAVPTGNPGGVTALADLGDPALRVVLCAAPVPCGAASLALLEAEGLTVRPASAEQSVTAVLTKVAAGEADAGLVYATDVRGRADLERFVPEGAEDIVVEYPIATVTDAANPAAAAAFVAFVLGPEGKRILAGEGFLAP
ncbi:molybdate ABC transporter substrate-binding protein [Microbacterium lacus]|uniref:molybdate ABC transporter substrate-binding protein n=1 Tax=Microbacterium lacus TaxID=415217 RepID=UPI00384AD7CB